MQDQCVSLTDLPDLVLVHVCHFLDSMSLNLASQACVTLWRCASSMQAGPPSLQQHFVVRAARVCLASVLHLPPWALECCLDFSRSCSFPISLAMHSLRASLAVSDVQEVAESTARTLQACIARLHRKQPNVCAERYDPAAFFSACRADRGYVRLALRAPAVVRASLLNLHAPDNLELPARLGLHHPRLEHAHGWLDASLQHLSSELLHSLTLDGRCDRSSGLQAPGPHLFRGRGAVADCHRCCHQLCCDLRDLLSAAGWSSAGDVGAHAGLPSSARWDALESALWSVWAVNPRVLQSATATDVQALIRVEQACCKGSPPGGPCQAQQQQQPSWSVVLCEMGTALMAHMKGTGDSSLSHFNLPPTTAVARMAALLRGREGCSAEGGCGSCAPRLAEALNAIGERQPREALLVLVQLAMLRAMCCCASRKAVESEHAPV